MKKIGIVALLLMASACSPAQPPPTYEQIVETNISNGGAELGVEVCHATRDNGYFAIAWVCRPGRWLYDSNGVPIRSAPITSTKEPQ